MLVAAGAVLLPLHALRMQALVLRREVIPILTLAAREDDLVSGHGWLWAMGYGLWATANGEEDRTLMSAAHSGAFRILQ
jgi:hypothetical protein